MSPWSEVKSVEVPLCDAHKSYWILRRAVRVAGAVPMLICSIALMWGAFVVGTYAAILVPLFAALVVLGLVVTFEVIFLPKEIRVLEITARDIALTNVSPQFAHAVTEEYKVLEGSRSRDREASEKKEDDDHIEIGTDRQQLKRPADTPESENA
jgi:hypothetical protein